MMKSKNYEALRSRIEGVRGQSTSFSLVFTRSEANSYKIDIPVDIIPDILDNICSYLEKEQNRLELVSVEGYYD